MTVKNRIKTYCKAENLPITVFEKSIGVSNGYVNAISKSIGIEYLNKIIEIYSNLNIEWLLTGKGEMLKPEQASLQQSYAQSNEPNEHLTAQGVTPELITELLNRITEQAAEIGRLNEQIRQMQKRLGKDASDASTFDTANAG